MAAGFFITHTIISASKQDIYIINRFIEQFFLTDEPLVKCLHVIESILNVPEASRAPPLTKICIDQGTSLKAVAADGEMIGVSLNRIITKNQSKEEHPTVVESIGAITKYLDDALSKANVFEKFTDVEKILEVHLVCVSRDWRQKGIGNELVENSRNVAKEHGCKLILIHCTSAYSQKIAEKLGFECIYTSKYADYLGEDGNPCFITEDPHTGSSVYILKV